jgi:virginiamycin B lyase
MLTEYGLPHTVEVTCNGPPEICAQTSSGAGPYSITAGPDGNLWFTEQVNQIGRITTSGVVTEFQIPSDSCTPNAITTGPDGNLWFTEVSTGCNKVAKLIVPAAPGHSTGHRS